MIYRADKFCFFSFSTLKNWHGDFDHLGETKTIIDNFKVDKVIINNNKLNYYEKRLLNKNTIIGEEGLSIKLKRWNYYYKFK